MSTTPGPLSKPTQAPATTQSSGGWFPSLDGLNLPRNVVNGIRQSFTLLYSLRDTVAQHQNATAKMMQYGSKLDRQNTNAQSVPDGSLWFETDTKQIYQARMDPKSTSRQWFLT